MNNDDLLSLIPYQQTEILIYVESMVNFRINGIAQCLEFAQDCMIFVAREFTGLPVSRETGNFAENREI